MATDFDSIAVDSSFPVILARSTDIFLPLAAALGLRRGTWRGLSRFSFRQQALKAGLGVVLPLRVVFPNVTLPVGFRVNVK